jgi:hypothetical protein
MLEEILDILGPWKKRIWAAELFPVNPREHIKDVRDKYTNQKNAHVYVYCPASLVATKHPGQTLSPGTCDVQSSQTCGTLGQEREYEQHMKEPLDRSEPSNSSLRAHLQPSPFS